MQNRRNFLTMAALLGGGAVLKAVDPLGLFTSSAKAAELMPFCPCVDSKTRQLLEEQHLAMIGCCNHCLDLIVGQTRINLFDQSFLDLDPAEPGERSVAAPIYPRRGMKNLDDVRRAFLEDQGFGRLPHPDSKDFEFFTLNGSPMGLIFKVIQTDGGQRILCYAARVPDGWRWYNDPVTPNLVGWVLGAFEQESGQWNRDHRYGSHWNPVGTFSEEIGQGRLRLRANAFIALA